MSKHKFLNVLHARDYEVKGEKRTAWTKCGVAFPNKNGEGFSLELEFLPLTAGPVRLQLMPPTEKEG